jgi:hypothetical protein
MPTLRSVRVDAEREACILVSQLLRGVGNVIAYGVTKRGVGMPKAVWAEVFGNWLDAELVEFLVRSGDGRSDQPPAQRRVVRDGDGREILGAVAAEGEAG